MIYICNIAYTYIQYITVIYSIIFIDTTLHLCGFDTQLPFLYLAPAFFDKIPTSPKPVESQKTVFNNWNWQLQYQIDLI